MFIHFCYDHNIRAQPMPHTLPVMWVWGAAFPFQCPLLLWTGFVDLVSSPSSVVLRSVLWKWSFGSKINSAKGYFVWLQEICLRESEVVLCGGSESMSQAPYAARNIRFGTKFGFDLKVCFVWILSLLSLYLDGYSWYWNWPEHKLLCYFDMLTPKCSSDIICIYFTGVSSTTWLYFSCSIFI